jgi:hypothetical protein
MQYIHMHTILTGGHSRQPKPVCVCVCLLAHMHVIGDTRGWLIQRLLLHYLRFQQQIIKFTSFVRYFVYQLLPTIVKCVLVVNVGQKFSSHIHIYIYVCICICNSTYKKAVINGKNGPHVK